MTVKSKRTLPSLVEMQGRYQCKYCHRPYKTEKGYIQHLCLQMKRARELTTSLGQQAWVYYQHWFKVQKLQPPTQDLFPISRYYRRVMQFAEFVRRVKLFQPLKFIEIVTTEYGLSPVEWMHPDVYYRYTVYIDEKTPPQKRMERMVTTLDDLAGEQQCSVAEAFEGLTIHEIVDYIQRRDFTPWILLCSEKFRQKLRETSPEQREIIKTLIPPNTWRERFQQNTVFSKVARTMARELGI